MASQSSSVTALPFILTRSGRIPVRSGSDSRHVVLRKTGPAAPDALRGYPAGPTLRSAQGDDH